MASPEVEDPPRRRWSRLALATLFLATGVLHFVAPAPYERIVPHLLPRAWARPLVYASGVAELAGAALLLDRRTRRVGAWWLVALLVVVFPANVQMAVDDPSPLTIGRLPLQAPLLWWAWTHTRQPPTPATRRPLS